MDYGEALSKMKYVLKRRTTIDFEHFLDELVYEKLIHRAKERGLRTKKEYSEQIECIFSELSTMDPRATYTQLLTILNKMGRRDITGEFR